MEIITKTYQTAKGSVEGVQTKWQGFNILYVSGPKGFLACPAIDVDACERYGVAALCVGVGQGVATLLGPQVHSIVPVVVAESAVAMVTGTPVATRRRAR